MHTYVCGHTAEIDHNLSSTAVSQCSGESASRSAFDVGISKFASQPSAFCRCGLPRQSDHYFWQNKQAATIHDALLLYAKAIFKLYTRGLAQEFRKMYEARAEEPPFLTGRLPDISKNMLVVPCCTISGDDPSLENFTSFAVSWITLPPVQRKQN